MDEDSQLPEYSSDDLDNAFNEALIAAESLHKKIIASAEDLGYVISVIELMRPAYANLYEESQKCPELYPMIPSGINFLNGLTRTFIALSGDMEKVSYPIGAVSNSTGTFSYSSDSASLLLAPTIQIQPAPLPPHRKSREEYSAKLRKLDSTLANSYDEVWQTYFGTVSDPQRASLFMMRTLFDNFFAHLASDEDVRNSIHWQKKDTKDPDQTWRSERQSYALAVKVTSNSRRTILEAETSQINILYKAVNSAHSRGTLDEEKASKTLMAMDSYLRDWLDAIDA